MTFFEYSGLPLRDINFDLTGGRLTMRYCKRCESRRWLHAGQLVNFAVLREHIGAMQATTGRNAGRR